MAKIYEETNTSRFSVECMGKPCDYYSECRYPPVYCNSHYSFVGTDMIEVKEFVKGRKSMPTEFSFYSMCRRDDEFSKIIWNRKMLKNFVKRSSRKCTDIIFDFDTLKNELSRMGLWYE